MKRVRTILLLISMIDDALDDGVITKEEAQNLFKTLIAAISG